MPSDGTVSAGTVSAGTASWNAMNPRIQGVLAP